MRSLSVVSACAAQLRSASGEALGSLQTTVERTVQATMAETVEPRLRAMTEAMQTSVETYLRSLRASDGELRALRESVEALRELLATGAAAKEAAEVTEGEIDALLAEGRVGELILRLGNAKEHPLLLYALEQIVERNVDLTDGVEPGLLITLAYMAGDGEVWDVGGGGPGRQHHQAHQLPAADHHVLRL